MSNHFNNLKLNLSKLPRDHTLISRLNDIHNDFIYTSKKMIDTSKSESGPISLNKFVRGAEKISSTLHPKYQILSAIFYSINSAEYFLINNYSLFWDNLFSKMIIDLDEKDFYKKFNYKSFIRKKLLVELLTKHIVNDYNVLRYLADYLNINIVIMNERLIYSAKKTYDTSVGTVLLCNKDGAIYANTSIYKNSIYGELETEFKSKYNTYEHIILMNIAKYTASELNKICESYELNNPKMKKADVYEGLKEFMDVVLK